MSVSTLIIIDWDDTIWTTSNHTTSSNRAISRYTRVLETFLSVCRSLGHVCIVTAGTSDWIRACMTCCPVIRPLLQDTNIYTFDQQHSTPIEYKSTMFKLLYSHFEPRQLISVGDSLCERAALASLRTTRFFYRKNIKTVPSPTTRILTNQLRALVSVMPQIVAIPKNLDLMVSYARPVSDMSESSTESEESVELAVEPGKTRDFEESFIQSVSLVDPISS